ncbi:MAG: single-stranded DNA-binding protein [Dysgonamonadaceae bacterium]|jgi:single-strand DNA-binding protein|nr:single-stranded DNA-binding protein [Dysgonamonadaceae bacterium]
MSVNKIILLGNVGKDPEVRYFDNGGAVANFSLATTEKGYTAANGTQVPDRTEWHNIVLWRGLAEIAEKYVKKGSKIYVEGKIRTRSYDDTAGNKRYITEVWGDNMELLDKKPDGPGAVPFPQPPSVKQASAQSAAQLSKQPSEEIQESTLPSEEPGNDLPF